VGLDLPWIVPHPEQEPRYLGRAGAAGQRRPSGAACSQTGSPASPNESRDLSIVTSNRSAARSEVLPSPPSPHRTFMWRPCSAMTARPRWRNRTVSDDFPAGGVNSSTGRRKDRNLTRTR
jgi:hypothetical protein